MEPILNQAPPRPSRPARHRHPIADAAPRLRLTGRVDATTVQKEIARTPKFLSAPDLAHVDLSEALSFDITGILVLLAAVSERISSVGRTKFRLPSSDLARHVLRIWKFPAAVSIVAGAPFRALVERSDLGYFGESWPQEALGIDTSPARYLMDEKPFGLSAYKVTDLHSVLAIMDEESEHWRSYAVAKLLERLLPGKNVDDIARVILQELVSNILQHSGTTKAVVASRLNVQQDSLSPQQPEITIALWDDGASSIDVLRDCLGMIPSGKSLNAGTHDIFKIQPSSWSNGRLIYTSDWVPDSAAADPELLLASMYIGISPMLRAQASSQTLPSSLTLTDGPEGLLPLYRTVLHHFRGALEVRSKASVVNLCPDGKPGHYKVDLAVNNEFSPLRGNLITVKLPVADV